jgi:hypothetical protein
VDEPAAHWYRRCWEESRGDDHDGWGHSTWLFETTATGDVIRQIEIYERGPTKRYDHDHGEDDAGGLTYATLPAQDWTAFAIDIEEFQRAWNDH